MPPTDSAAYATCDMPTMKRQRESAGGINGIQTGKIHQLPGKPLMLLLVTRSSLTITFDVSVRVYYNLPDSLFSYTTILSNQEVFIHKVPDQGRKRRRVESQRIGGNVNMEGGNDEEVEEYVGSISLRAVVLGICASRYVKCTPFTCLTE